MALRKLTDGKRVADGLKALEELQRDAEAILNRYQSDSSDGNEQPAPMAPANGAPKSASPRGTNPPQDRREGRSEDRAVNKAKGPSRIASNGTRPAQASSRGESKNEPEQTDVTKDTSSDPDSTSEIDRFTASLEALRASLRDGRGSKPEKDKTDAEEAPAAQTAEEADTSTATEPAEPPEIPPLPAVDGDEGDSTKQARDERSDEDASGLERMPTPTAGASPTPLPEKLQRQANGHQRKNGKHESPDLTQSAESLQDALQAVRNSVAGLTPAESSAPAKAPTPKPTKKRRPLSDGIPKSISEDLPKFHGQPRMRICNRCGHETKLRNPRCERCGRVDESLGILDAVIAGDLAKVEQILLVRPHLITVRTSRHEWTLLHMAASGGNWKMAELLIAKGASVNAPNRDGKTPLHYAAGKGHIQVVESLLTHHADPEIRYHGKTAEDLARDHGKHDVAEMLHGRTAPRE